LLFQALDAKSECFSIYSEGGLIKNPDMSTLTHTWTPTSHYRNKKIEYAQIWCHGQSLAAACPPSLKEQWQLLNTMARAYINSFNKAQINLNRVCIYDLLPEHFLLDFYEAKNQICEHVFNTGTRPKNYEFMHDLLIMLKEIEQKQLNIQMDNLEYSNNKVRQGLNKVRSAQKNIVYNPWVTATGRLSASQNSFPILTLNKELRSALVPNNDFFVELDYNSAELRVLLGLLGQQQPEGDIHSWIAQSIYNNKYTRDETKKKVFSWLYNPKAKNKKLNQLLDREKVHDIFYKDAHVHTPFNRELPCPSEKAVSYIVQSTTSDLFLTSAIKISKMLQNKKSYVAFCIHDSLVIDFAKEDQGLIEDLIKQFSSTMYGTFKTNLSVGKNFGVLKRVV
tara:strand:+ start:1214 stop:2392 length:1179 start_codon:yes stop_codon:yes gene_type:complete